MTIYEKLAEARIRLNVKNRAEIILLSMAILSLQTFCQK